MYGIYNYVKQLSVQSYMKVVLEVRECMCIIRKSSYNDLSLHILLDICSLIVNSESHVLRRLSVKREKLNMQHASL